MSADAYTTKGNVRGCCGHKHRSLATAFACMRRDQQGCERQGGYSDRRIVSVEARKLRPDELDEIEALWTEAAS